MAEWNDDSELFGIMKEELFSAVIGDVMDVMSLTHQFLPAGIRPLRDDSVVAGRAMPVLEADCGGTRIHHADEDKAFGLMFEALGSLRPGEIYLCTGASPSYTL